MTFVTSISIMNSFAISFTDSMFDDIMFGRGSLT